MLDMAAHSPANRPTATIFADKSPVGTFWSYMHDGPANAAFVCWIGNYIFEMLDGKLSDELFQEGLSLMKSLQYPVWFPSFTPGYLSGGRDSVTMRSDDRSEEIATLWTADEPQLSCLVETLVNGYPDLLLLGTHAMNRDIILDTVVLQIQSRGFNKTTVTAEGIQAAIDWLENRWTVTACIASIRVVLLLTQDYLLTRAGRGDIIIDRAAMTSIRDTFQGVDHQQSIGDI